jgi:T5orf172 domain
MELKKKKPILSQEGYVYLMQAKGTKRFKIGLVRKHPRIRQAQLNSRQNAYEIEIITFVYSKQVTIFEAQLKKKYEKWKVRNEWFELDQKTLTRVIDDFVEGKIPRTIAAKKNEKKKI